MEAIVMESVVFANFAELGVAILGFILITFVSYVVDYIARTSEKVET